MSRLNEVTVLTPRDGRQRFVRTPENMERDHEAAMLRSRRKTYAQIGEHFGVSKPAAYQMVQRAIGEIPKEATVELIALELAKFDHLEQKYYEIMERFHPHISASGQVIEIENDDPTMKAMEGLLKISDRRAKLLGLNAPTRTELTGVMVNVNVEDNSERAKASVLGLLARLKDE